MPITTRNDQINVLGLHELQQTLGCARVAHRLQSLAFDLNPVPTEKAGYVLYLGGKIIGAYLDNCYALGHFQERQSVSNGSASLTGIFPGNGDSLCWE